MLYLVDLKVRLIKIHPEWKLFYHVIREKNEQEEDMSSSKQLSKMSTCDRIRQEENVHIKVGVNAESTRRGHLDHKFSTLNPAKEPVRLTSHRLILKTHIH